MTVADKILVSKFLGETNDQFVTITDEEFEYLKDLYKFRKDGRYYICDKLHAYVAYDDKALLFDGYEHKLSTKFINDEIIRTKLSILMDIARRFNQFANTFKTLKQMNDEIYKYIHKLDSGMTASSIGVIEDEEF